MATTTRNDPVLRLSMAATDASPYAQQHQQQQQQQQPAMLIRSRSRCADYDNNSECDIVVADNSPAVVSSDFNSTPVKVSGSCSSLALNCLSSARKDVAKAGVFVTPPLSEQIIKEARSSSRRLKVSESLESRIGVRDGEVQGINKNGRSLSMLSQHYVAGMEGYYISPGKQRDEVSLEEDESAILRRSRMELIEMQLGCRGLKKRSQRRNTRDGFEAEQEVLCEKGCCDGGKMNLKSEGNSKKTRTKKNARRGSVEVSDSPREAQVQQRGQQQVLRQKRKTPEEHSLALSLLPEPPCVQKSLYVDQRFQSVLREETESSVRKTDWRDYSIRKADLQELASIIMWEDVPRTTLIFGLGCFFFSSVAFLPVTGVSAISTLAYTSLIHLAAVFFHQNFPICKVMQSYLLNPSSWEVKEVDVGKIIQSVLPTLNLGLRMYGQYLNGEPATTFKVALVVWLLAQLGCYMSFWTFARLAFISLFSIPKLYNLFGEQLHGHGQAITERVWIMWNTCSHKKAIAGAAFLLVWKLSTVSTRIWGVFIAIVALRLYQQSYKFGVTYENNAMHGYDSCAIPE